MEYFIGSKLVTVSENSLTTHLSDKLNHNTWGKSREDFTHGSTPKPSLRFFWDSSIDRLFQLGGK